MGFGLSQVFAPEAKMGSTRFQDPPATPVAQVRMPPPRGRGEMLGPGAFPPVQVEEAKTEGAVKPRVTIVVAIVNFLIVGN